MSDLGPRPEPEIDPGDPNPGGPDAVDAADGVENGNIDEVLTHDLDPDANPAVDDVIPDEVVEPDDSDTEATKAETPDEVDEAGEADEESPA